MLHGTKRALLVILVLLTAFRCRGEPSSAETSTPSTLLFAVDGMEWNVMKPLLDQGKLPVIAQLMRRGSYGYLGSMSPTLSPVIWTSVATGKLPEKHGIHHFIYSEAGPGGAVPRYYTSGHRQTKAFWNMLSDYGRVVHCVGWWMTYPAESINGVMVSQTNTTARLHDPDRALWKGSLLKGIEGQVHPPERQQRVMQLLKQANELLPTLTDSIFGSRPNPMTAFDQLMWDQTQWALRADATYLRVAGDLLAAGEAFDLLAIYLGGADVVGHRFWRYAYADQFANPPKGEQIVNFGNVIDDYYVYLDRAIGELLDIAGPGVSTLIISDHGMHAANTQGRFGVNDPPAQRVSGHHLDEPPGVLIASGPVFRESGMEGTAGLEILGNVLDIAPTLLLINGIPLGKDMDGTPLLHVLADEDPSRARYVETHDDAAWLAGRSDRIREAVDQSQRLEQLRALGYIQ